ncbi:DUF397 domain-containing protein [Nocardiopsis alba]|uniref:DUF397 domain-containing protein n=1 Tax=Nocardiopsis alba TaxID=53437 RepID=A0ABV5DPB9_9ACTN
MRAQDWHKSSYSGNQGACVEVAEGRVTGIRDTQNRELGHLDVPASEWNALLNALQTR